MNGNDTGSNTRCKNKSTAKHECERQEQKEKEEGGGGPRWISENCVPDIFGSSTFAPSFMTYGWRWDLHLLLKYLFLPS